MSEEKGRELADLYMRGVNEASDGEEIQAQDVLDVLSVFGEDGVRMYMLGVLEGIEGLEEERAEERAELAYEISESSISVLEEDEERMEIWIERCNPDLEADGETDLHILDDEDEIIQSGVIVKVEFQGEEPEDPDESRQAKVTIEKYRYVIVEYEEPWDPTKE